MDWGAEALEKLFSNQKLFQTPSRGRHWLICWESLLSLGGKLRNSKDLFQPQALEELAPSPMWLCGLSAF